MLSSLLLLAQLACAQEASSPTATVPLEDSLRLQNVSKDIWELRNGRPRISGKPTFASGICFGDGTCMTTAPSGSAPTFVSSFTVVAKQTISAVTLTTCYSSVTWTAGGSAPTFVMFNGPIGNTTNGVGTAVGLFMDGAYVGGNGIAMSSTRGLTGVDSSGSSGSGQRIQNASFIYKLPTNPSAGSHNICLQAATRSGFTATLCDVDDSARNSDCRFGVVELK